MPLLCSRSRSHGGTLAALLIGCALTALATRPAQAQQIVVTNPGPGDLAPFGNPIIASFGQVVTAPVGSTTIDDFSFTFARVVGGSGDPSLFRGYVFGFNSTTAQVTGPALFTSAPLTTPSSFPTTTTVFTAATPTVAGNQYLLLFSSSGLQGGQPNTQYALLASFDTYAGGTFVGMNSGDDPNNLVTGTYDVIPPLDLGFTATFGAAAATVPEPSEYAAAGLFGATLFFGMVKARRKAHTMDTRTPATA